MRGQRQETQAGLEFVSQDFAAKSEILDIWAEESGVYEVV